MTNDKTVTMSRELAQKVDDLMYIMTGHDSYPRLIHKYGKEWWTPVNEMRAEICTLLAAPVVERQEPVVIDLDAVDWETIQQAADESNWMPNEYMRNEWVADVCNFLKYGRADASPPASVSAVLPEPFAWYTEDYLTDKSATTYDVGVSVMWTVKGWPVTPLYTSQPAPVAVVLPTREVMRDLIAEVIGGDAYDCTRVWSAWGVGTMSEDDFVPLVEQEERLYELADACLDKVKELNQ